jgi:SecD/SecF GG Motif
MIGQNMRSFRLIPDDTHIPFVRYQYWAYAFSGALILLTLILLPTKGLNLGIDFQGGILIEVGMPGPADLAAMRSTLGDLGLGEVALQEFGGPANVLIRVQRQEGGKQGQLAAVNKVKAAFAERFGNEISYRRVEFVGPKVSEDLLRGGTHGRDGPVLRARGLAPRRVFDDRSVRHRAAHVGRCRRRSRARVDSDVHLHDGSELSARVSVRMDRNMPDRPADIRTDPHEVRLPSISATSAT